MVCAIPTLYRYSPAFSIHGAVAAQGKANNSFYPRVPSIRAGLNQPIKNQNSNTSKSKLIGQHKEEDWLNIWAKNVVEFQQYGNVTLPAMAKW